MIKLIPILLALAGLGGGVAAGFVLRPAPPAETATDCAPSESVATHDLVPEPDHAPTEFVKLGNQFVIPIMGEKAVTAMVVLSLSVEVVGGTQEAVFAREPKLRDVFLRVLFDHANAGGFNGNFFSSAGLDTLRAALKESAIKALGPSVKDVLIVDLVKQEV